MSQLDQKIKDYEKSLKVIKDVSDESHQSKDLQIATLKKELTESLSAWERIQICRHQERPRSIDYIEHITDSFTELHGDRHFGDDPAIVGGLGYISGKRFIIIAQEKGNDTESRGKRNFGMCHPEGYRKALRLMEMGEKFSIPVVCLIDTPGAFCGLAAEERGQGSAIATNLLRMSSLKTPIICVLIGEGASGGALGIGVGDVFGMLEHAYYSVISPEGCAMILFKDATKSEQVADVLKVQAEYLLEAGVIDEIINEPAGGAHTDKVAIYQSVKKFILNQEEILSQKDVPTLLEERYNRFRKLGSVEELKVIDEENLLV